MHDPMVVAFKIRRPWPQVDETPLPGKRTGRWDIRWSAFWKVAGRRWYWPSFITVWHVEPDGRDSGEVCKPFRTRPDGKRVKDNSWRWHVRHWKVQIHPAQALRRWLLTRCEWCGGPSRKGARVNCSHQWDSEPGPWWRGERGLFHMDCSTVQTASRSCVCDSPVLDHDGHGNCARCEGIRAFGRTDAQLRATAVLQRCPAGEAPTPALLDEAQRLREETAR